MVALLLTAISLSQPSRAADPNPSTDQSKSISIQEQVTAMARIGGAFSPSYSPDGKRIAFLTNISGSPQVWVMAADGGYPQQATAFDDPISAVAWSPIAARLAFSLAPGGGLNTQIYFGNPDGTGIARITPGGEVNSFFEGFADDGRFAYATNERNPAGVDALLYDPASGKSQRIAQIDGLGGVADLSLDGKHALLERLVNRGDNNLYLVELATGNETLLTPHRGPGTFFGAFAADGKAVYLGSNLDRDLSVFGRIDIRDGKPGKFAVLSQREDANLAGLNLDDARANAALTWNVGGRDELSLFELASGKERRIEALPADIINSLAFAPDGRSAVLALVGSALPSDLWRLSLDDLSFTQLTFSPHAGVDLSLVVRPELRSFKAHDGLALSGWLYLPKNYRAPGPIVLSFHGGPEGQERPSFRSDYQALLARGIAVFAPNIRGSSGFGKRFVNLDNGAKRFDANKDIKSAADYVVAAGIADAKRVGIMGGSYGGYATMVGLTDYPETFAAGANLYGIVNFKTFFAHTQPWMAAVSTVEYGDPKTQADLLERLSPLGRIDRITSPTLVLHGANDTNVPVVEAEQVVDNLKRRHIPVEYVLFPDEGHGWRKTPNRIRSTVTIVEFFDRYLN
jgi:dipeptidyl aminopeptidase/acylaminoacyl peptidase